MQKTATRAVVLWLLSMSLAGCVGLGRTRVEVEQVTPVEPPQLLFTDDTLETKSPAFDPDLVDSRPFDVYGELWEVNASDAVIGLDIMETRDIGEERLQVLYASYAEAARALGRQGMFVLPSINMVDGKAKQFDDGLYAAIDMAVTYGQFTGFAATVDLLQSLLHELDPQGQAYAWIWGGLEIGLENFPDATDFADRRRPAAAARFIEEFEQNESQSKPIGFYTWSHDLERTFRMLRYFQTAWRPSDDVTREVTAVSSAQAGGTAAYRTLLNLYAGLSNPLSGYSFADLADPGRDVPATAAVRLIPSSTSPEVELFNRMFDAGLQPGTDLMAEFVMAIRDGRVDLTPRPDSGWYDYQVYALETFLLPERGPEHDKLLLTAKYKERLLQAFEALVTKRRETHARQLAVGSTMAMEPPPFTPRLRLEPNPTYYLRVARSYAFLETFLQSILPHELLNTIHGRREGGERDSLLSDELELMRDLFYGLHLVSCEDIGMHPDLLPGELDSVAGGESGCYDLAVAWIESVSTDADLAVDPRVAVPVFADENETALWCTLGVRGVKLKAWYAVAPRARPGGTGDDGAEFSDETEWQRLEDTMPELYIILVDESAEVRMQGHRALSRGELRTVCDEQRTKDAIVSTLSAM